MSVGAGCAPPSCNWAKVQGLLETRLKIRGAKLETLLPMQNFWQGSSWSPIALLIKLECLRKSLHMAVEKRYTVEVKALYY